MSFNPSTKKTSIYLIIAWFIYSFAFYILGLPFALLRLFYKGLREIGYWKNLKERFALIKWQAKSEKYNIRVWLHAVSVGETRAASELIKQLLVNNYEIILTNMTPTGRQTAYDLFSQAINSGQMRVIYLPYDCPDFMYRFFSAMKADVGIIMETELWPNLMLAAEQFNLPLILANARLSVKSFKRMQKFGSLVTQLLNRYEVIACQTEHDFNHFKKLNVDIDVLKLVGNLKFDVKIDENQQKIGQACKQFYQEQTFAKPVILWASTRDCEEALLLNTWYTQKLYHNYDLMIVPRHLPRVDELKKLAISLNFSTIERTNFALNTKQNYDDIMQCSAQSLLLLQQSFNFEPKHHKLSNIFLGNSMGEMAFYIAMSDIVLIGGSWIKDGCQNFLEACMQQKPVICGPSRHNFQEASDSAIKMQACIESDTESYPTQITHILNNYAFYQTKTKEFSDAFTGATIKHLALIKDTLNLKN